MNGSRSNNPRPGAQSYGDRSSLDALNRTIEGLEARIEGLMGTAGRDPRSRPPAEREAAATRPDPVTEIMQRQRTLTTTRERDAASDRMPLRAEARTPDHHSPDVRGKEHRPADQRGYEERKAAPFQPVVQPRREMPVAPPLSEQLRSEVYRSEFFRREPVRPEPTRNEPTRNEPIRAENPRPESFRHEPVRSEPQRPDPAMAEIAQALVGLRQELKKDIADGLSREMTALRAEIRGITVDAAQDQTMAEDIRGDLQRLSDSINQLGRQASPSQADALKVEFDELRVMIDGLAREDSVHRMETRWNGVEDRMNAFDANRDDELVALAYRLDEIKSQLGSMNSGPALHALEDKLVSVAQAIEMIGRHMQPDDRRMASQFADLDARLDEISRAIVASGRTIVPDTTGVIRVEGRLADLSRQIDGLQRSPDNGLGLRIEALAARVEELANEEAAVRLEERLEQLSLMLERSQKVSGQPDLTGYLSDISRKIDALDQGSVNDALAERLDDLARRIDQLDMPSTSYVGDARFDRLEGQLSEIASRLEETHAAPYDDSEILRSLQDQIANLSSLVSLPREAGAVPAEFEGRMSALEDYMATSDEYIIEAARQAAEAVMEAYSKNGMAQTASGGADMAAISALADDLKLLEDMSRSSEERTARTFEALHETLVHIAEKLERLEERGIEHEAPRAFGSRGVHTQPQMPRAAQPDFETNDDSFTFADTDFGHRYEELKRDMQSFSTEVEQPGPSREEVAEAVAVVSEQAAVHQGDVKLATAPAKAGLLAGLTKRFSGKRAEPARVAERQVVDPTPPIDAADAIEPDVANQLLEPGSGVPDVKKILERVRAGQNGRTAPTSEADKADFIAAARRAAQQAAEEVDTMNRGKGGAAASPIGGALSRHRRPILMAVGAVLLAIMSYPLVNTLISGERSPAEAPVAAIEQPLVNETPETANVAPVADAGDNDVEPLSTLQPQAEEKTAGQLPETTDPQMAAPQAEASGAAVPETKLPDAAQTSPAEALPAAGNVNARMLSPVIEGTAPGTAAGAEAAAPPVTDGMALTVPADIKPEALADAAKKGDPLAMFEIGAIYTEGRGIRADLAEAAKWYQRAADAGVIPAQYRLASLYEKGTGVGRDLKKARTLYQQAADQGNASAMHNLAVMLASGGDTAPDFAGAGKWFTMAADRGIRDSQFNLAILYARGNGVTQDLEESYKWFAVAARDGDADAAQKRDEVGKALKPDQLKSAKAKFDAWKLTPVDPKANSVDVPDTWVGKGVKTASIDMKKALRNIQAILNNNGFDAGTPDGEMGNKTTSAIKAFQKSIGQEPNGQITDALVKELLKRNS